LDLVDLELEFVVLELVVERERIRVFDVLSDRMLAEDSDPSTCEGLECSAELVGFWEAKKKREEREKVSLIFRRVVVASNSPIPVLSLISDQPNNSFSSTSLKSRRTIAWNKLTERSLVPRGKRALRLRVKSWYRHERSRPWWEEV